MSLLNKRFWSSGEPFIWLTGGALTLCLILVVGLVALILGNGLGLFWPKEVLRATLTDGTVMTGQVVSTAMQKTVTVAVDRLVQHALYKKTMRKTSKFLAHDENNSCKVGDQVRIVETRPLSARKRWRVVEVLSKAG